MMSIIAMKSKMHFKRSVSELEYIFRFLKRKGKTFNVCDSDQYQIELSVEELFTNMVRHNNEAITDIEISLEKYKNQLIICISGHEEDPFDITKTNEVDLDEYIKLEKSGGLGIHLVKQIMDDIQFDHSDGLSTITMIKKIEDNEC